MSHGCCRLRHNLSPGLQAKLRSIPHELSRLGYTAEHLGLCAGVPADDAFLYLGALWGLLLRKDGEGLPEALARLFFSGAALPWERLANTFSREALDALLEAELLVRTGDEVRAPTALVPFRGLYFVCDFPWRFSDPSFVYLPDISTGAILQLATEAATSPRGVAIDLGTGSGIIALFLARGLGFGAVRAVDVNPRSLALTSISAAMNGVTLELAQMDAAQALAEARDIELVTFALPHLYTVPKAPDVVAHAARDGEGLLWNVLANVGGALAPNGKALLYHQAEEHFAALLEPILNGNALSAVRVTLDQLPGGVEFGITELVRGPGPKRLRTVRAALPFRRETLQRQLTSAALLEGPRDALLQSRPAVSRELTLSAQLDPMPRLFSGADPLPEQLLPFLAACDGTQSLERLLHGPVGAETIDVLQWLVARGVLYLNRG